MRCIICRHADCLCGCEVYEPDDDVAPAPKAAPVELWTAQQAYVFGFLCGFFALMFGLWLASVLR